MSETKPTLCPNCGHMHERVQECRRRADQYLRCTQSSCEQAKLVWMDEGQWLACRNGDRTIAVSGWYCPVCGGGYGGTLDGASALAAPTEPKPAGITGDRLTALISNAHRLLRRRYKGRPLWALVRDLTGNGGSTSVALCREAGYDPSQPCGGRYLRNP